MAAATVHVDEGSLRRLTMALLEEAEGSRMRLDLRRNLRVAAEPVLEAVRASILTMPSKGTPALVRSHEYRGGSLRAAIAGATRIHTQLGRRAAGVEIISHNTGIPRNFKGAARKLNSPKPWRHPVFGNRRNWVEQRSRRPRWFVDPILAGREGFTAAAGKAMDGVAGRISTKTKG